MKEHPIFDFICGVLMGPILAYAFLALGVMFLVEVLPASKDKSEGIAARIYLFIYGFLSCIVAPVLVVWPLLERPPAIAGCLVGGLAVWLIARPAKRKKLRTVHEEKPNQPPANALD